MRFIRPTIFDDTKIISAVSTRNGGFSKGAYESLNLGKSTADDKKRVEENRKLFFSDLGIDESKTVLSYQVHGCEILQAEKPCRENGFDALITDKKGLFLLVSIADCIPVLMYDPAQKAVAGIHSGWRETVGEIVPKTIKKMSENYCSDPQNLQVFIGPGISNQHFEVGKEVAVHFPDQVKSVDLKTGKYFVDLKEAIKNQCKKAGVLTKNIEISPFCTFKEQHLFFSHRRDGGVTGRMVAVIGLK